MNKILSVIVVAQFLATSLWFAGNAVIKDLAIAFSLSDSYLGHLTSAVQIGFISGTLVFAIFTIADRHSPSKIFFLSAISAGLLNLFIIWFARSGFEVLLLRFGVGFFLAGIYPVGMKIASDYFDKGLGKSLGFLVGALVLGTSLPHLLKSFSSGLSYSYVLYATSIFSWIGGFLILFLVPDGPFRKKSQDINLKAFSKVFNEKKFKAAASGYFGHMWELYTFWAFVPTFVSGYMLVHQVSYNVPLVSFFVIGIGGVSCTLGGLLSTRIAPEKIAGVSLGLSGICCLLSPLFFFIPNGIIFIFFLLIWGMAVTADSPMFSTLVASHAPSQLKATALTIVNSLGFAITILSIQLIQKFTTILTVPYLFLVLSIGPVIGLIKFRKSFEIIN